MSFKSYGDQVANEIESKIQENMENLTQRYETLLKEKLDTPPGRSGRIYPHTIVGKHQASAPGEPPAPMTRELLESVQDVILGQGSNFKSAVYSPLSRALWLETGTGPRYTQSGRYTGRVEARPAWVLTLMENREELAGVATDGFQRRA